MTGPEAQFSIDEHAAYLTFNRPAARNALTWAMYDALVAACDQVGAAAHVRVLVVRSTGDAFAAGTDIQQFTRFASADDGLAYERRLDFVIDRLERIAVPTIAQVQGVAAGAGCVIALACDLRVCTAQARFGIPIARTLGNCLSAANYARLVDCLGTARAKELLLTGRFIDASEAASLGLITRLAEPAAVGHVVRELAATLAQHAPLTLSAAKETARRLAWHRRLPDTAVDDLIRACYGSDDFREGVASFLAGRRPRFHGR